MTIMALFVLAAALVVGAIFWQTSEALTRRNISSVIGETKSLSEIAARDGVSVLLHTLRERRSDAGGLLYGLADVSGRTIWLGGLKQWPADLSDDNITGIFEFAETGASRATAAGGTQRLALGATLRLPDGERLLVARDVTAQRELAGIVRNWFLAGIALLSAWRSPPVGRSIGRSWRGSTR